MEDKNIINRTGRHTKIAILWVAVMCGLTLHSLADLMPLFWNEAIAISETGHAPEGLLTFMMSCPCMRYSVIPIWENPLMEHSERLARHLHSVVQPVPHL